MTKRILDIAVSILGLIVLSPLLIAIGIAIFITEGKPIFFVQERIGKNFKKFNLYKFRSMTVKKQNTSDGEFELGNQLRVTPIGRVLRKAKLDELPQLVNVLIGNMSLVGPRPEVKKWVDAYPLQWGIALRVKPGITDQASILFGNEEELLSGTTNPEALYKEVILPQKLRMYREYTNNRTLLGDLKIIFKTASFLLKKRAL